MELAFLSSLALVMLVGLLALLIAAKTKIPHALLLLLGGIGLQYLRLPDATGISIPQQFTTNISLFALALLVFYGSSGFKISEFDDLALTSLRYIIMAILFNLFLVGGLLFLITGNMASSLLFAAAAAATAAELVLGQLKKHAITTLLQLESLLNDPFVILIPFLILGMILSKDSFLLTAQFGPFFQLILTGVGTGLVLGLILVKILMLPIFRARPNLSDLALMVCAIITFTLAERLGGNGALGCMVAGIVCGNSGLQFNTTFEHFLGEFSNLFQTLIFVLVGLTIQLEYTIPFLIASLCLYGLHIIARYLAARVVLHDARVREQLFMALIAPKGVIFAVVLLNLAAYNVPELSALLPYGSAFILLSIAIASIANAFSEYFLAPVKSVQNN